MISMITNRSDLYQRLWDDYFPLSNDQKNNSFFYKYLKKKKDDQAAHIVESSDKLAEYSKRKKQDKYISLRYSYLAYNKGILTEKEYIDRLTALASAKDRKSLSAMFEPFSSNHIDEAEQTYENIFLIGSINDFFYNMGFRRRKTKDEIKNDVVDSARYTRTNERYLKEDGYIDDLDLWARYYTFCLKDSDQPPHFVSALTNEYIQKCSHLFSVLDEEQRSSAFIPLYFDPMSGAGVIIIGSNLLPENKRNNKNCRICIAYFSILGSMIDDCNEIDITMISELYDDIDVAFEDFKTGIAGMEYYCNYGDQNDAPPEGIDSIFHNYFSEEPTRRVSQNYQKLVSEEQDELQLWKAEEEWKNKRQGEKC